MQCKDKVVMELEVLVGQGRAGMMGEDASTEDTATQGMFHKLLTSH